MWEDPRRTVDRQGWRANEPYMDDEMDTSCSNGVNCAIFEFRSQINKQEVSSDENYPNWYRFGKKCFSGLWR